MTAFWCSRAASGTAPSRWVPYRSKEAADTRLADVKAHGIKTTTYRQREQTVSQTMIVLREPTQATVSKLEPAEDADRRQLGIDRRRPPEAKG